MPINTERQKEMDIAKALMICCLAFIHCTIECTSDAGLSSGIPYLFDTVIGGPLSAPMYMFAMGFGMVYASNKDTRTYMVRGLRIIITGYILNIFRFVIPYTIGYAVTGEYETYIEPLIYKTLGNDILIFAGLAMILIAVFIKIGMPKTVMALVAFVMSITGSFLTGIDVKNPLGNIFLGYVIGTEDAAGLVVSDFPMLNWLIFPVMGYLFGNILSRVKDKKTFYSVISIPSSIITVIYFAFGLTNRLGMFGEGQNCYYHMRTSDALASLLLSLTLLGLYYAISEQIPDKCYKFIKQISQNINSIYCIHWVIIGFSVNLLLYIIRGTKELPIEFTMLLGAAISIVSIIIARFYKKVKSNARKKT